MTVADVIMETSPRTVACDKVEEPKGQGRGSTASGKVSNSRTKATLRARSLLGQLVENRLVSPAVATANFDLRGYARNGAHTS